MRYLLMNYGVLGVIRLALDFIGTKIAFRKSRLIRFPIDIRGRSFIDFGSNLTTGRYCRLEVYPIEHKKGILKIGDNVEINDFVHIAARLSVQIGNNVLIASKVFISDIQHGCYNSNKMFNDCYPDIPPKERSLFAESVFVGDNVWIGESVSILAGVKIGDFSIIGANSVVCKSIPSYSIAVGNPATVIKKFNKTTNEWEKV